MIDKFNKFTIIQMKENPCIKSKIWRLVVVLWFFISIPSVVALIYWLYNSDWFVRTHYDYEIEKLDSSKCEWKDYYEKEACLKAVELAWLLKRYYWYEETNYIDIIEKTYPNMDENEEINDYLYDRSYIMSDISDFSRWNWFYKKWYQISWKHIFKFLSYSILVLVTYIILTDIFRWAVYYIDNWKYELWIWNKMKSKFQKK